MPEDALAQRQQAHRRDTDVLDRPETPETELEQQPADRLHPPNPANHRRKRSGPPDSPKLRNIRVGTRRTSSIPARPHQSRTTMRHSRERVNPESTKHAISVIPAQPHVILAPPARHPGTQRDGDEKARDG